MRVRSESCAQIAVLHERRKQGERAALSSIARQGFRAQRQSSARRSGSMATSAAVMRLDDPIERPGAFGMDRRRVQAAADRARPLRPDRRNRRQDREWSRAPIGPCRRDRPARRRSGAIARPVWPAGRICRRRSDRQSGCGRHRRHEDRGETALRRPWRVNISGGASRWALRVGPAHTALVGKRCARLGVSRIGRRISA